MVAYLIRDWTESNKLTLSGEHYTTLAQVCIGKKLTFQANLIQLVYVSKHVLFLLFFFSIPPEFIIVICFLHSTVFKQRLNILTPLPVAVIVLTNWRKKGREKNGGVVGFSL
jgi:hypothetical protein